LYKAFTYHLANFSNSLYESSFGFTIIHHFHHHKGNQTTDVFILIQVDKAITSSFETSG
jgi:hypothetical protein